MRQKLLGHYLVGQQKASRMGKRTDTSNKLNSFKGQTVFFFDQTYNFLFGDLPPS